MPQAQKWTKQATEKLFAALNRADELGGELRDYLQDKVATDPRYVAVTLSRLQLSTVDRRVRELKSRLQRLNPVTHVDEHLRLFGELVSLEQHARALRDQAAGGL